LEIHTAFILYRLADCLADCGVDWIDLVGGEIGDGVVANRI
jgi:hypothetical protein